MSGEAIKWARRQQIASAKLKNMLNVIAIRADRKGKTWVSQQTLADDMALSARHVRRLLCELARLGVIERRMRSAGGRTGRLTDEISLPLHRTFKLTKSAIVSGHDCPVTGDFATGHFRPLQPDNGVQGIEREEHIPSQEGTSIYQDRAMGRGRPAPAPDWTEVPDPFTASNVIAFGRRVA